MTRMMMFFTCRVEQASPRKQLSGSSVERTTRQSGCERIRHSSFSTETAQSRIRKITRIGQMIIAFRNAVPTPTISWEMMPLIYFISRTGMEHRQRDIYQHFGLFPLLRNVSTYRWFQNGRSWDNRDIQGNIKPYLVNLPLGVSRGPQLAWTCKANFCSRVNA